MDNNFGIDKVTTFKIIKQEILDSTSLTKQASVGSVPEDFDPDFLYVKVRAVSAGEFWGPNKNADFFEEEELKSSYHTFMDAHVFKNHENKQVENAIGSVLSAYWDPNMHYVQLLIKIDRSLAPQIVRGFEKGITTDVSMGCKVKYTMCSLCKNKAKTRAEFCEHVKTMRNQVLADGRRVFEYNYGCRFHDISVVLNGADRTAKAEEFVGPIRKSAYNRNIGEMLKTASTESRMREDMMQKVASTMTNTAPELSLQSSKNLMKTADFTKLIIDKLYTLALLKRINKNLNAVDPKTFEKAASSFVDKAISTVEKAPNPFSSLLTRAALTFPVAMLTNNAIGKMQRGEETTEIQRFMADNPGLMEGATLFLSKPTFELGRKGVLKVLDKFKKPPEVAKTASLSPYDKDYFEKISSDYTNLFSETNADFFDVEIDTTKTRNIFKDAAVDSELRELGYSTDQIKMMKVALVSLEMGRDDLVEGIKNRCKISDSDISQFVKVAMGVVDTELEKMAVGTAQVVRNMFEDSLFTRPGMVAASLPAMLVDGVLMSTLIGSLSKKDKEKAGITGEESLRGQVGKTISLKEQEMLNV